MAESRVFAKVGGVTIDGLGRSVQNFLRNKSLTVQGGRAGQGYVVQAKSDDGWRNISGTASAIEVQISDIGTGILVNVGNGQWTDKIGAATLGWFVFALPTISCAKCGNSLPVTAHFCDKCGTKVELENKNNEPAPEAAPAPEKEAMICSGCGTELAEGDVFCSKCGHRF